MEKTGFTIERSKLIGYRTKALYLIGNRITEYLMVINGWWLIPWLIIIIGYFGFVEIRVMCSLCSQCMNFACPLNSVDLKIRRHFFERNPEVAEAWDNN